MPARTTCTTASAENVLVRPTLHFVRGDELLRMGIDGVRCMKCLLTQALHSFRWAMEEALRGTRVERGWGSSDHDRGWKFPLVGG